jgi:hypothetical protein
MVLRKKFFVRDARITTNTNLACHYKKEEEEEEKIKNVD